MAEPQIRYAKTPDGVSIAFWALGNGGLPLLAQSPLVFGHLTSEWDWQPLRSWYEHIAERRTFIRFDTRNHGLSQRGVPIGDADMNGLVSDIEAVADRLELEKFALMTQGGNAPVALAFAARFPSRVSRMVLCDPMERTGRFWEDPTMKDLLALSKTNWPLFTEAIAQALNGWGNRSGHAWAQHVRRSVDQADFQLWVQEDLDATALLHTIEAPVLVMNHKRFPPTVAQHIAASMPNARLYQHDDVTWQDEGAAAVMDNFLAEGDGTAASLPSGTAVILFTDIVDSTALTERMGDAAYRTLSRSVDERVRAAMRGQGGTVVEGKVLGDGVMGVFTSASQAIAAARACVDIGQELPMHIGLHAGDVTHEAGNVYGGAVNIASRICGLSAPGEILVSDVVRGMARSSAGVVFEDRGEQEMKGVGEAVRVYRVDQ